jgi:hypothetical protein
VRDGKEECLNPEKEVKKERGNKEYILENNSYPLEKSRWGYIPTSLVKLFREKEACKIEKISADISNTNTEEKDESVCLLRHGVEPNSKKSFLACMADQVFYGTKDESSTSKNEKAKVVPSIEEFTKRIEDAVTLDRFIKYQNGNLVETFYSETDNTQEKINENKNKYSSSLLYKRIKWENKKESVYFNRAANAYENFKEYLNDKDN